MTPEQLEALRTASEIVPIHRPWRGAQLRLRFVWAALRSADKALIATAYVYWANIHLAIIPLRPFSLRAHTFATGLASDAGDPHALVVALSHESYALFWAGDFARSVQLAHQAEQLARNLPASATMGVYTMSIRLLSEIMRGNMRAVCNEREELEARAREVGTNLDVMGFEAVGPLLADDRLEEAQRLGAQLLHGLRDQPRTELVRSSVLWFECDVASYAGDSDRAWELGDQIYREASLYYRLLARFYLLECRGRVALQAAIETGRPDARAALVRCARGLTWMTQPHARAYGKFLFAGEAALAGKRERAYQLLDEAAREFRQCGMELIAQTAYSLIGAHLGGEAGEKMAREADAFIRSQVANPTRYSYFMLGGLPRLL